MWGEYFSQVLNYSGQSAWLQSFNLPLLESSQKCLGQEQDVWYGGASQFLAFVAQLDRALPSGGKGRGFESRRMHHLQTYNTITKTSP